MIIILASVIFATVLTFFVVRVLGFGIDTVGISLLLLITIVGFLGFCGSMVVGTFVGEKTYLGSDKTYTLETINDSTSKNTSGSFFLGIGSFSSSDSASYAFYQTDPATGGSVLKTVPAEAGTVYQVNTDKPYVRVTRTCTMTDFWWGPPIGRYDCNEWAVAENYHYDFYVPRGSITTSFELDAK